MDPSKTIQAADRRAALEKMQINKAAQRARELLAMAAATYPNNTGNYRPKPKSQALAGAI